MAWVLGGQIGWSAPPAAEARALAQQGVAAAQADNPALFLEKMEAAVALRPDYPRMLVNLAAAQVANGQLDAAVSTLSRLAALGTHSPVEKAAEFAPLRGRKDFQEVAARIASNNLPKGEGKIAFSVPGMTGIVEGIAYRPTTGEYFFGDPHGRCIWVRTPDGKVRRWTAEGDGLWSVFGLQIDEERDTLWAATSAVAAMREFTEEQKGLAGLADIELSTGRVRRVIGLPADHGEHVLGDLTLAADGTVYVTDSGVPVLWRLVAGSDRLENFLEHEEFMSLQGIVAIGSGAVLLVSDYANGLLRVDVAARQVRRLESPPDTTLLGLDGLTLAPDGLTVLAIQNGVRPRRVVALQIDEAADGVSAVRILESAHLTLADPTLGCVVKKEFVFIGNAGWTRFEDGGAGEAPRPVPIFKTTW